MNEIKTFWVRVRPVVSAIISGALSAVLAYVANLADITQLDTKKIFSVAMIAVAASLLKNFSTTDTGHFVGAIKIK